MKDPSKLARKLDKPSFLLQINAAGWLILMCLDLLQSYSRYFNASNAYPWLQNLSFIIPHFFNLWLLAIPVYLIFKSWKMQPGYLFYLLLFAGGILFGAIHISLTYFEQILILWVADASNLPNGFLPSYFNLLERGWPLVLRSFLFYSLIVIAIIAINFYKRYNEQYVKSAELESQLSNARLKALKMQLHPHFLFNALNTISMMVRRNQGTKAVDMISGLSDMLRGTLWKSERHLVPLEEEIMLLKKYLDIEKVRFKEQLNINIEIEPKCRSIKVPNLILLPIVENAFKHGATKRMSATGIRITATCNNERLFLVIYNEGPMITGKLDIEKSSGTGLKNTIDRLEQLYGLAYNFKIENLEDGVQVTVEIPIID